MTTSTDTISNRLLEAMQRRGMTITNLAYAIGVSKSSVSEWLRGGGLNIANMAAIAIELNISLDWLLLGKGHMDLFGPIHPTSDEMQLINRLRETGPGTFHNFSRLLSDMAKPVLGDDPVNQILALDMLEKSNMALIIINQEGFIIDASEACLDLMGDNLDKAHHVVGTHFMEWLCEESIPKAMQRLVDGRIDGHSSHFACLLKRRVHEHCNSARMRMEIIVSSVFHGQPDDGHFQCVVYPLD